jgi:hypothetical protein
MQATVLILIGYSVTGKVVVKFRTMPLRQLIDLRINQTSATRLPHR